MNSSNITFAKFVGAGNDFILIDDRSLLFASEDLSLIQTLCCRQIGIGADGLILLQPSLKADFKFRIFNSDASEAEMCGNGMRCFGAFLFSLGLYKDPFFIETKEKILTLSTDSKTQQIVVEMGQIKDLKTSITLLIDDQLIELHHINTGVPHLVIFCDQLDSIEVQSLGAKIRYHEHFAPKGCNVNFVKRVAPGHLQIRTYERGVEKETLACGTGATAAALITSELFGDDTKIKVGVKGGDTLLITFSKENGHYKEVKMSGSAFCTFTGTYFLQQETNLQKSKF